MTTIDKLLTKIINHNFGTVENLIPSRDVRVLRNIARIINEPVYITENQAKLLVKVLNEHKEKFSDFTNEIDSAIVDPVWERNFRIVENIRKVYITEEHHNKCIAIEATFSSEIRNYISQLAKVVSGLVQAPPGKKYYADLTEKNIVAIVEKLKQYKFVFSDEVLEYYETIKSWSKDTYVGQYQITTITHPNFERHIINDLGIDTAIDQNVINDRSLRYQYFVKKTEKTPETLTEIVATRTQPKIWVNNAEYNLTSVLETFLNLRRLPTLVVFDTRDSKKCLENLQKLSESLEKNGIFDGIGIYFRLDNDTIGKEFNQLISDKQYNCHLDHNTKIVGVQSGKIPKFLLKTDWKPMSVVSLDHALRHSKTAVYANCCDLIVTYTSNEPIIESRHPWE